MGSQNEATHEHTIKQRLLINTAQMAGLLAYRYMSDQDPYWLDLASGFADYAVSRQGPDGNYSNYTTVAYPVKSVMTVMAVEKRMAAKDAQFGTAYESPLRFRGKGDGFSGEDERQPHHRRGQHV